MPHTSTRDGVYGKSGHRRAAIRTHIRAVHPSRPLALSAPCDISTRTYGQPPSTITSCKAIPCGKATSHRPPPAFRRSLCVYPVVPPRASTSRLTACSAWQSLELCRVHMCVSTSVAQSRTAAALHRPPPPHYVDETAQVDRRRVKYTLAPTRLVMHGARGLHGVRPRAQVPPQVGATLRLLGT